MPELVACPVCGCRVQMAEALLGRQVRCVGCNGLFTATADQAMPELDRPPAPKPQPIPRRYRGRQTSRPLCPCCQRPVAWTDAFCPYCGLEFDPEVPPDLTPGRPGGPPRRDCESHRGPLISTMGNVSLVVGGLSVCLFGLGALLSVPLGIVTWVLANQDLARMRQGIMDPAGRESTETGRTGAILGVVLGSLFAACYSLWWFGRW